MFKVFMRLAAIVFISGLVGGFAYGAGIHHGAYPKEAELFGTMVGGFLAVALLFVPLHEGQQDENGNG